MGFPHSLNPVTLLRQACLRWSYLDRKVRPSKDCKSFAIDLSNFRKIKGHTGLVIPFGGNLEFLDKVSYEKLRPDQGKISICR
jgi:hypothetical protein